MSPLLEIPFDKYHIGLNQFKILFIFVISHFVISIIVIEHSFILAPKKDMCSKFCSTPQKEGENNKKKKREKGHKKGKKGGGGQKRGVCYFMSI